MYNKFMAREFDFYIVPTPIGNISDITLRAIEILKSVDFIACEDTRTTQKLLNHYDIRTKCVSYHKHNERERVEFFINELKSGKKIALVSDAGTPMICDPGAVIVPELLRSGFSVTSLPGACAVTTFLSQIPRDGEDFKFIGFIPITLLNSVPPLWIPKITIELLIKQKIGLPDEPAFVEALRKN